MGASDGAAAVDAWFDGQHHDLVGGARMLRDTILAAAPAAVQSVKWQAPNFAIAGTDFATFSMRRAGQLQLILHTGTKPRPDLAPIRIAPIGPHFRWADHNRAVVTFLSDAEVWAASAEVTAAVQAWTAALSD
ncbi:hypothetical protein [Microbacterium sp. P05]|uniref:hypothetical protein n=1 Tax=Microbacterium sp. P05 TaxID=3366948 RepID=UPI003746329B